MTVRVTFKPGLSNVGAVSYNVADFRLEPDQSISLIDTDWEVVGSIHSDVWEDVLAIKEETT